MRITSVRKLRRVMTTMRDIVVNPASPASTKNSATDVMIQGLIGWLQSTLRASAHVAAHDLISCKVFHDIHELYNMFFLPQRELIEFNVMTRQVFKEDVADADAVQQLADASPTQIPFFVGIMDASVGSYACTIFFIDGAQIESRSAA